MTKYCRVLPDKYWWKVDGELVKNSRHEDPTFNENFSATYPYPAVVGLTATPTGGATYFRTNLRHWELVHRNNTKEAMVALRRLGAGLWNRTGNTEIEEYFESKYMGRSLSEFPIFPQTQGITCVGAVMEIVDETDDAIKVLAMHSKAIIDTSPEQHPELWFKFTSIATDGSIGNAPEGHECWIPLVTKDGCGWITKDKVEILDEFPQEEQMQGMFFVDISKWQAPYEDDQIDEGWPLDGVIIKVQDGTRDYSDPDSSEYSSYWKEQWDSVIHFERLGGYGWYQTEQSPITQAQLAKTIAEKLPLDFYAIDFESYYNQITEQSINDLKLFVSEFKNEAPCPLVIYTNGWIYNYIRAILGTEWVDKQQWWMAGGAYYNIKLTEMPPESYFEALYNIPGRWGVQFSADGNQLADELDVGTSETASIDYNYIYLTEEEYKDWCNDSEIPQPPSGGDDYEAGYKEGYEDGRVRGDSEGYLRAVKEMQGYLTQMTL